MKKDIANYPQDTGSEDVQSLIADLHHIIEQARKHVATTANYELTMMYWHIGKRINRDVLNDERATYGQQIVATVSRQLQANEMEPGEDSPLGLLLCTEGSEEQIELLQLDKSCIKVAQYMTELPPRNVLMRQIQKSLILAKAKHGKAEDE